MRPSPIRFPAALSEALTQMAIRQGKSRSELVREIVGQEVARRERRCPMCGQSSPSRAAQDQENAEPDEDEWDSLDSNGSEVLLHEWHDHPPLGYHDEAVPGCPSCEARWESVKPPAPGGTS